MLHLYEKKREKEPRNQTHRNEGSTWQLFVRVRDPRWCPSELGICQLEPEFLTCLSTFESELANAEEWSDSLN
jgi:hypothetical protein